MRVGLITPDPGHPLLAAAAALLTASGEHEVEVLDPAVGRAPARPADVYLLKSRTPRALALARDLEAAGARVVNSTAATARLQDRTAMARDALRAGLPFAPTRTYASGGELALALAEMPPAGPVVVKSRCSRKEDVVVRLEGAARIRDFASSAPHEPFVVQDFVPNPGWDHKLWAIGPHVFAALRRSELSPPPRAAAPSRSPTCPRLARPRPPRRRGLRPGRLRRRRDRRGRGPPADRRRERFPRRPRPAGRPRGTGHPDPDGAPPRLRRAGPLRPPR